MAKYSYEQKFEVVLAVVEKGYSAKEAGDIIGACKGDAQKWVKLYQEHGVEGLLMKHGSYDGQFKLSVVEYMHANHLSIRETAVKFGIPSHTVVGKWERVYYEEGSQALFQDRRGRKRAMESTSKKPKLDKKTEEDLIAENQRLRMEIDYLKKLNALIQSKEKSVAKKKQQS
jgi:Transposase and inactivated derivatives